MTANMDVCLAEVIVVPEKPPTAKDVVEWQASHAVDEVGMCTGESTAVLGV
jgi:hypothetical protein